MTAEEKNAVRKAWELSGAGGVFVPFAALPQAQQDYLYSLVDAGRPAEGVEDMIRVQAVTLLDDGQYRILFTRQPTAEEMADWTRRANRIAAGQQEARREVPREPTEKMLLAAYEARATGRMVVWDNEHAAIWQAMFDTAQGESP